MRRELEQQLNHCKKLQKSIDELLNKNFTEMKNKNEALEMELKNKLHHINILQLKGKELMNEIRRLSLKPQTVSVSVGTEQQITESNVDSQWWKNFEKPETVSVSVGTEQQITASNIKNFETPETPKMKVIPTGLCVTDVIHATYSKDCKLISFKGEAMIKVSSCDVASIARNVMFAFNVQNTDRDCSLTFVSKYCINTGTLLSSI